MSHSDFPIFCSKYLNIYIYIYNTPSESNCDHCYWCTNSDQICMFGNAKCEDVAKAILHLPFIPCNLHVVHNAFHKGHEAEELVLDLLYYLKAAPSHKEDYFNTHNNDEIPQAECC